MKKWMKAHAKAIAAFVGSIATWFGTAYVDGSISMSEWGLLAAAVATTLGVYQVTNVSGD